MKQWYCLRAKSRQERIAHERLACELGVESFLPMITRPRRGKLRPGQECREPLFPGYLFARLDLGTELRKVSYAQGVLGFVRMGDRFPSLTAGDIEALMKLCDELDEATRGDAALREGDAVELVGRLFGGTKGMVKELIPAKNRVRVLIEFLSRSVEVDVGMDGVIKAREQE